MGHWGIGAFGSLRMGHWVIGALGSGDLIVEVGHHGAKLDVEEVAECEHGQAEDDAEEEQVLVRVRARVRVRVRVRVVTVRGRANIRVRVRVRVRVRDRVRVSTHHLARAEHARHQTHLRDEHVGELDDLEQLDAHADGEVGLDVARGAHQLPPG